jgi:hypothetical protein
MPNLAPFIKRRGLAVICKSAEQIYHRMKVEAFEREYCLYVVVKRKQRQSGVAVRSSVGTSMGGARHETQHGTTPKPTPISRHSSGDLSTSARIIKDNLKNDVLIGRSGEQKDTTLNIVPRMIATDLPW